MDGVRLLESSSNSRELTDLVQEVPDLVQEVPGPTRDLHREGIMLLQTCWLPPPREAVTIFKHVQRMVSRRLLHNCTVKLLISPF